MPYDLAVTARPSDAAPPVRSAPVMMIDPGVPGAVLRALAAMARASKRHQAELGVALRRAGLMLSLDVQAAAVQHLADVGSVVGVIPLDDGGVLVSVTSAGMERAYR